MAGGLLVSDIDYPAVVLSEAEEDALWLRARLEREGLTVNRSSDLGLAIADTIEFARQLRGEAPSWDYVSDRERLVRVTAFSPLFRVLRRAALEPMVNRDNLRLLTKTGNKKPANRAWEFRVGLAAARFSFAARLHGEHENPDVSFYWAGSRWGVECYVLWSANEQSWRQALSDKATQLNEVPFDRGFIAVNATPIIDLDAFRQALLDNDARATRAEMYGEMDRQLRALIDRIDTAPFWSDIARQQIAGFFVHADAVTAFDGRLVNMGRASVVLRRSDGVAAAAARRLLDGFGT